MNQIFPKPDSAPPQIIEEAIADPAMFPRTDGDDAQLAVVTAYWNFAGYQRPSANLLRFLREMDFQGIPVYGMEILIPGSTPLMRSNRRWLCVEIAEENIIWQKEPMLNRIAKEVPGHIPCIAALDSDIHFEAPDWAQRCVDALESTPAIQPFTLVVRGGENGRVEMTRVCAAKAGLNREWTTNPGFGWAFRREFFEGPGFYPWAVTGGGDTATASGLLDIEPFAAIERSIGPVNLSNGVYSRWKAQVRRFLDGTSPGWIEGSAWHEWHGDRKHRRYVERHREIMETFDASRHVRLDENGLLAWTEAAPDGYREKMRSYFSTRHEDGR